MHRPTHLSLRQIELAGQFCPFPPDHILAPLELHLQPIELLCSEGGAGSLGSVQIQTFGQDNLSDGAFSICNNEPFKLTALTHN